MKVKIGVLFRKERNRLHLTQSEFTKNVISVSQYSRVENGEQDLRATDFIKLISANNLDINLFLNAFQNNRKTNQEILQLLAQAFYDRDLPHIKEIKEFLSENNYDNSLLIRAELIISLLESKDINHNKDIEEKFLKEINKSDNWTEDKVFLQLFGSSMLIFPMSRLNFYMSKILRKYGPTIYKSSFEEQRRIAGICINYLNRCYLEKDFALVAESLNLLNNLTTNPDLLMYKLLGKYFKYLFSGDEVRKDDVLNILKETGYEKFILNLAK